MKKVKVNNVGIFSLFIFIIIGIIITVFSIEIV